MGAVGGVAILGGNFEAPQFPEDKFIQRSLTVGDQEASPIEAIILDAPALGAPGQLDSHAMLWKGHSNDGSPHTIDWKLFVDVTADDGTGSLWTLQTRIDVAAFATVMTIDDNGLLTVSGATFTMDQLIIDADNTEAVLIRKDGDAGDVFIVDTVNDVVRLGSDDTLFTFGAASDVIFRREAAGIIALVDPGSSIASGTQQEFRIQSFDAVGEERYLEFIADRSGNGEAEIRARRAGGGGQYDLILDVNVGALEFFNEGVERWSIQGSVTADFEFMPFITNRYDLGNASFAVRNLFTNGVLIGQDQTATYDAITIDGTDLAAPGQQDSGAIIFTGLSNDGSPHDIDWKAFVDVTANDGTGSIWTLQTRIDAGGFVDRLTVADSSLTLGLPDDIAAIHLGASADAQIHRGDAADILEQRRGVNPQEWRLYDRFVSHADYDRLVFYIGGGPVLKTAEIEAQSTTASQPIDLVLKSLWDGGGNQGQVRLQTASNILSLRGDSIGLIASPTGAYSLSGLNRYTGNDLRLGRLLTTAADSIIIDLADPSGLGDFEDSGAIVQIGRSRETPGGGQRAARWNLFVDVLDAVATSQYVIQNVDQFGAGTFDLLTISDAGLLSLPFSGSAFTIGTSPAQSGSIRLPNAGDIVWRNAANDDDIPVFSFASSDIFDIGDASAPTALAQLRFRSPEVSIPAGRFEIAGSSTSAFRVLDGSAVLNFSVDTTDGEVSIAEGIALFGTPVDRLIITAPDLTVDGTFGASHAILMVGKARESDSTNHDSNWRVFVDPFHFPPNDGQSDLKITAAIDGAIPTEIVKMTDEGRFAVIRPEQVSFGGPFVDNVQVNITGSFVDDYGGGPTTTHKFLINGSQTGDAGRTNRQTIVDVSGTTIITQNASQTVNEVGGMFLVAPSITPGTDTINIAYTLKVFGNPTLSGTENYGLLVDSSSAATNLIALTRIGKSFNQGIKLLVGGGVGFENIEGTAQMRLTNVYTPDGLQTEAMLLHVHTTLQATDGTTDHITGAFFQGSLRTQVEPDENVANISQVRIDEPNIQDNLTGTGEITNAQSLLITGAPTEGESNYAQRILGGDLQVAASSAFLFRNNSNSLDLTALANAPTDFLEIGGVGAGEWERVNIYSLGSIRLLPTDEVQVRSDNSSAFRVSTAGNVDLFQVQQTQTRVVTGSLVVAESIANNSAETEIQSTFADVATSAGSSVFAAGLIPAGSFVIGVTVRVLSTVLGPASFDVGDGTDVDRWGASIAISQLTTTDITDFTTSSLTTFPFANDVRLTSTGVDFTGGSVRITVHYMTLQTSAA